MRAILILALGGLVLTGCQHPKSAGSPTTATGEDSGAPKKRPEKAPSKSAASKETGAQATAVKETSGKVASVNPNLRFVVIDFSLNSMPSVDQRMNVYRQGQKVGEVRISSQSRNSIIAADVTAGDAQVGDEVRAD